LGRLTCTEVNWSAGTAFAPQLQSSATAGSTHDQLRVNGPVSLGGATLNPDLVAGFTGNPNDVFVIIDNDGTDPVTGTFAGLPGGSLIALPGARVFRIGYSGGSGNDVTLRLVETPLPSVTSLTIRDGIGPDIGKIVAVITGTGIPNVTHQLETSTDLLSWSVTQSAAADATGVWTFTDKTRRPRDPKFFLRVRLP
jgi:hypothetical protein